MKKFIFILVALAFMACEKTIFVGGTVTDHQSGDSIEGLDMGLYAASPEFDYENKKWSDLELIARGTTNNDGFFSMEIDAETNMSHYIFYFPLPTIDTLSANAKYRYSSSYETDFLTPDYSKESEFRLERSSSIQVKLINFTQEQIEMRFADGAVRIHSLNYLANLSYKKLLAGQKYIFDFFEVVDFENQKEQLNYLGSTSHFIKTQLPEDEDKVEWFMPWQIIEIDYNTLERRLLD